MVSVIEVTVFFSDSGSDIQSVTVLYPNQLVQ